MKIFEEHHDLFRQAVRAFGSNRTQAPRMRAGAGASAIGSCQTVPVNESAGMRRDGIEPDRLMSMKASSSGNGMFRLGAS
jgi:hypothetical protein